MKTITTIVVDDESIARSRICRLLAQYDNFELKGEFGNSQKAYDAILKIRPDIIFLDIEMPGMSGIELVQQLGKDNRPLIVFVTAYNKYAIQAFDFFAIDYLLKPFTADRFDKTISRVVTLLNKEEQINNAHQIDSLLQFYNNMSTTVNAQHKRLPVPIGNKVYFIDIQNIKYVIADGNYVNVFVDSTKHVLRETLNSFEEKLNSNEFIRIHKSYIINLEFVKALKKTATGSYQICMTDDRLLNISKTYKSEVFKRLKLS